MSIQDALKLVGANSQSRIGLARNPAGTHFQCGTCKWFDKDHCENPDPKLHERRVQKDWCCNLYDHPGMRVII